MTDPREELREQAHRAVSLLLQAARISPVLVEAVRTVDRYLHHVEGENDRLRKALERIAEYGGGDGGNADYFDRCATADEMTDAVLDALGLEQVGHGWCPIHGDALCPEDYMLRRDGGVAAGYRSIWSEESRCGQREPTYRLAAPSGTTGGAR